MNCRVGVDLGGTKILIALEDAEGNILQSRKFTVSAEKGPAGILQDLLMRLTEFFRLDRKDIEGLGFCLAGYYDKGKEIMLGSPNLPGWENYPILRRLRDLFECPVVVENDANAAAWGEYRYGAGKGAKNILMVTLGTGVGCALIEDGRLVHGERGLAGEIGHLPLLPRGGPLCGCGNTGCLESLASGKAIAREGLALLQTGKKTLLSKLVDPGGDLQASHVFEAARQGDEYALNIIDSVSLYLAQGLVCAVHLLDPDVILLGGGLAGAGEILFAPLKRYISQMLITPLRGRIAVLPAQLGEEAGVRGVLGLLRDKLPG